MDDINEILKLGAKVIPLQAGTKRPGFDNWQNEGRDDATAIEQNYGVLCDGITVVDFDPRNMPVGAEDVDYHIEFICDMYGLDSTFAVRTGGGGLHLYYSGESPAGKLAPGVDIKSGHGHFVVGPGSIHPNGTQYTLLTNTEPIPISLLVQDRKDGRTPTQLASAPEDASLREFGAGERNEMVFKHMSRMRSFGANDAEIRLYALAMNQASVKPPLDSDELEVIIGQVIKYKVGEVIRGLDIFDAKDSLSPTANIPRLATVEELLAMPEPEYLVNRMLPQVGIGQMFGQSYAGKTFVAIDLAMSLATAQDTWMGETIDNACQVVYVAMEGGFDLGQRIGSWMSGNTPLSTDGIRFMVEQPFNIMNNDDVKDLVADLEKARIAPGMVIFDTQSLAAPMVDENSNSEMTDFMSRVKQLSKRLGCFVLLLHHTGHGEGARARGASAQYANLDVSLKISGGQDAVIKKIDFEKLKFGPLPEEAIEFILQEEENSAYAKLATRAEIATNYNRVLATIHELGEDASPRNVREAVGMTERTFPRLQAQLVQYGLIEVTGRAGGTRLQIADES